MTRRRRRLFAGLALALACGAALVTVLLSRGDDDPYELVVVVESANGVIAGAQVKAGGVQIGRIADVELAADGYPRVTMEVDDDYRVRDGVTANIRLGSVAGQLNRFVDLRNGSGPPLPSGTTLGLGRTDQPVEVQDMLELLTPEVRREVPQLVARVSKTLDERGPDIERTLRVGGASLQEVAALLDDVSYDRQQLRNLVRRMSAGSQRLAAADEELSGTVTDAAVLLDTAAARQTELREILAGAPVAFEAQRRLLRRVPAEVPTLRRTLRSAAAATTELGDLAQDLQRSSTLAPETMEAAEALLATVRLRAPLLRDLLATAAPALDVGARAARGAAPILDQFRARVPDSLGWLFLMGASTSSYDAVGHAFRLMGIGTEAPRRWATGCGAGLLRRPFIRLPGELACEPWEDFASSFIGGGIDPRTLVTPEISASRDEGVR
jgi:phospholipid/cholesterol/gamma-HCH transport system substrate-binding protein